MNRVAGILAVGILAACVLGCGRMGGGAIESSNSGSVNANANADSAKPAKAVEVGPLVGKTVDELKKTLGPPTRELAGRYTWEFPQGDLAAETDPKDKTHNKVSYLDFQAKMVVVGDQVAQGYPDYQRLGDVIGIDTRGKTPASTADGDTGMTTFEKFPIGSTTVDQISFSKITGNYRSVSITPDKGY